MQSKAIQCVPAPVLIDTKNVVCQGSARTCRKCRMKDAAPGWPMEQSPKAVKDASLSYYYTRNFRENILIISVCAYSVYFVLMQYIFKIRIFFSFMEISKPRGCINWSDQEDRYHSSVFLVFQSLWNYHIDFSYLYSKL